MNLRVWSACLALLVAAVVPAEADDIFTTGLYTVINYSGAYATFKKNPGVLYPSYLDGVEGDVGWRFNRFYSVEASYSYFTGSQTSGGQSFTVSPQTASIDGLGYLPFGYESPWALYGDVGATAYFVSASTAFNSTQSSISFGARAGGGLQFRFDEDLGLRLGARYEWANSPNIKSMDVFAIGLVWQH